MQFWCNFSAWLVWSSAETLCFSFSQTAHNSNTFWREIRNAQLPLYRLCPCGSMGWNQGQQLKHDNWGLPLLLMYLNKKDDWEKMFWLLSCSYLMCHGLREFQKSLQLCASFPYSLPRRAWKICFETWIFKRWSDEEKCEIYSQEQKSTNAHLISPMGGLERAKPIVQMLP